MSLRTIASAAVFALAVACSDNQGVTSPAVTPLPLKKTVIATYDLQSIAGKSLPLTYSGGDRTWQITGGHYVLFDDGTYVFGYEVDGKPGFGWTLPYVKRDSRIEFYLSQGSAPQSQFYANLNYLFSTATLSDRVMSVKYTDPIDFEDEVYVLRQ